MGALRVGRVYWRLRRRASNTRAAPAPANELAESRTIVESAPVWARPFAELESFELELCPVDARACGVVVPPVVPFEMLGAVIVVLPAD